MTVSSRWSNEIQEKTVVILGGGIAGLRVALSLEKKLHCLQDWRLLVVDENDSHQYVTRTHEIVGQRATPRDLEVPFRRLFRGKRIQIIQAQVRDIDIGARSVVTDGQRIQFDILVVALGSHTEFYAIEGLEENTLTLKTIADAVLLKARVEELLRSPKDQRIVVGGGGFTGVELMGELLDLVEAGGAGSDRIELILVEATDQLLPGWNPDFAQAVAERLRMRGTKIVLEDSVVAAKPSALILESGQRMEASLIVWTGGVKRDEACGTIFEMKRRRLCIDEYSRALGYPNIFIVGDCALYQESRTGDILPPSAHIAIDHGRIVAQNVYATIIGDAMIKHKPKHYGEIVTLGRNDATGIIAGVHLNGLIARLVKRIIHFAYVYSIGGFSLLMEGKGLSTHLD